MRKCLSVYISAYLTLLLVVCGMLCLYPKLELHLLLNSWHTNLQDIFFKYVGSIIGFTTPLLLFHFGKKKILKLKSE